MKELSIEEKAKAYDEVREKISIRFGSNVADEIFSQFEMSEDERMKEAIIATIHLYYGEPLEDEAKKMIAWLKEQKPVLCEEDIEMIDYVASILNSNFNENDKFDDNKPCVGALVDRLKSLKGRVQPNQEWSEEDKKILERVINDIKSLKQQVYCKSVCDEEINWLKSLRPQITWKPSDEQMEALRVAYEVGTANESWAMGILKGMYQDLKKLREE